MPRFSAVTADSGDLEAISPDKVPLSLEISDEPLGVGLVWNDHDGNVRRILLEMEGTEIRAFADALKKAVDDDDQMMSGGMS